MEYRQRRLVAAGILALSVLVVVYLIFFTPSESTIPTPTLTVPSTSSPVGSQPPSTPKSNDKRAAQVSGAGYGFYIHDADKTNYVVSCSNNAIEAEAGFSKFSCDDGA